MASTNSEALAQLAQSLGIELSFDGDNVCELLIDGDSVVAIVGDPEGNSLRLSGLVGDLEDVDNPAPLQLLLQANFNGQGVGDAALGMDHVSQEVFLTQSVQVAGLGHDGLEPVLQAFTHYLSFWRQNLGKLGSPEPLGDLPAAPGIVRV